MIPNKLHALWKEGKPVINGWLSIGNPFSAEIVASQGYDSLVIDQQHGLLDYSASVPMMQAIASSGVVPIVRVPWLDPAAIMKALDAGAYGILCPMINNRQEAEQLVSCMRYPPDGMRSFGPIRALFSAGQDYPSKANSEVFCLAMIETAEGMANLEEIVTTPGLDGIYIGPADLTLGLTNGRLPPGVDIEDAEMIEAFKKILAAAHGAGIKACMHCASPDYAKRAVDWGFDFVTLMNDAKLLANAAGASVGRTKELLGRN